MRSPTRRKVSAHPFVVLVEAEDLPVVVRAVAVVGAQADRGRDADLVDGHGTVLAGCGCWVTLVGDVADLDAGLAEGLLGLLPGVVVEAELDCKYWIQIKVGSKTPLMIRRLAVGDQRRSSRGLARRAEQSCRRAPTSRLRTS